MAANTTTAAAITKTQYTQDKVYWIALTNNPTLADIRKAEKFVGDNYIIATQIEAPQGGGVTIQLAQNHAQPGVYKRFTLSRKNDYSIARVTGEAMQAAKGNDGALIQLWTREMDGAIHTVKRSAAIHMYRAGTGSRGQVSSGSNVAANNITLARTSDATNFSVGLTIQLANTDGGTLRNSGANAVITKIDRRNGVLYFGDVLTNYIAAAQVNDFILREGDLNGVINGKAAWVPSSNVTSTLFNGLDRTPDQTRLAGQYLNCQGMSIREAVIESVSLIDTENGEADTVWLHTRDKATLVKELEAKSYNIKERSVKVTGSDAVIGYDVIEAEFDGYKLRIRSDINCPRGDFYVEQANVWEFDTLGPFPHIIDYDSLEFQRLSTDDSFEVRTCYRGDIGCLAPAFVVHGFNVGVN